MADDVHNDLQQLRQDIAALNKRFDVLENNHLHTLQAALEKYIDAAMEKQAGMLTGMLETSAQGTREHITLTMSGIEKRLPPE